MKIWQGLLGAMAAGALLVAAGSAQASLVTYTTSGPSVNGPVSASATITTAANSLTVSLSSLIANPTSAGQEVSGIIITLGSAPGTLSNFTQAGQLITIGSGGTATNVSGAPTHWVDSKSGSAITLTTLTGGQPDDLIIGTGSGGAHPYSNANSSIVNFNPQIQGTGTFTLSALGVTANTLVTGVQFEFGTTPDLVLAGTKSVPEPAAVILFGTGLLGLALARRRRTGWAA